MGDWLGVLVFCAAARWLGPRDRWIGWSEEQRRRRLPLVQQPLPWSGAATNPPPATKTTTDFAARIS